MGDSTPWVCVLALCGVLACAGAEERDDASSTAEPSSTSHAMTSSSDDGSTTEDAPECEPSAERGSWEQLAPMSLGRSEHSLTQLSNGDLIAVGARACATARPRAASSRISRHACTAPGSI